MLEIELWAIRQVLAFVDAAAEPRGHGGAIWSRKRFMAWYMLVVVRKESSFMQVFASSRICLSNTQIQFYRRMPVTSFVRLVSMTRIADGHLGYCKHQHGGCLRRREPACCESGLRVLCTIVWHWRPDAIICSHVITSLFFALPDAVSLMVCALFMLEAQAGVTSTVSAAPGG